MTGAPGAAAPRTVAPVRPDPVRLAVVGVGHLGRLHARVAAGLPAIALVGVHDHHEGRAEEVARERGLRVFAGPEEVAQAAEAVILATPTSSHGVLGRFFLERGLDVLVNCAATYKATRLEEVTAADVRHNFEANLLGTFLCAQQAGLAMVPQPEGGCIVNIGDWALARPYLNYAPYFASKGAIPALTRCLAVELGTRNPRVRVNCVHPGPVLFPPEMAKAEREEAIRSTLVQREGQPENVAAAVLFFVENEFVTGACLPVDGGRTIYAAGN